MAEPARKLMTLAEFLAWDAPGEVQWELYSGVPAAMAPVNRAHNVIVMNLGTCANRVLKPPCRASGEVGVLSPTRRNSWYKADVAVSCVPARPTDLYVEQPLLIAEVLSETTQDNDRTVKLPDNCLIPSVQEIVLLDSRKLFAEIHRRLAGGRWQLDLLIHPEERLILDSCGLDVALAELYEGVDLEPPPSP